MTEYSLRSFGECQWSDVAHRSGHVVGWCWAGHSGLEVSTSPPPHLVPTGWLWGWDFDRWVRWRVDPRFGCIGAELRKGESVDGAVKATVRTLGETSTVTVRSEPHMLEWASGSVRPTELAVITVIDPAPLTFMAMR